VRLTIFWRIMFAQVSLLVLIVVMNFYTRSQLHQLTALSQGILATDTASIGEEKRLLRIFFAQMRSAGKFMLFQDKAFYNQFLEGNRSFAESLATIATLATNAQEVGLLEQVRNLHARYVASVMPEVLGKPQVDRDRTELSDAISAAINELIRLREDAIGQKTALARDRSAQAAQVVGWLTLGGIGLAVLLASLQARSVSRPLRNLAHELRLVGKGEFQRYLAIQTPEEVGELARAFNWMASRLAKLDEMKEDFIARMSHELRTPLTAISEGTSLLWEEIPGPLTSAQREIISILRAHSERLYEFLSSVLDLSKMEAGMMEYVQVPSDLLALLERSVESVQLAVQRKRIQLEVICSGALPLISLDEGRMRQVFDNVLNNALKFTPEGGTVRVTASLQQRESEAGLDRWIEIRVSDTGIGISPDETERIFNKFYQTSESKRSGERGTGLGLAIAQHIVEAHGGRIWAESQLNRGSTFIILLPAHQYEPEQPNQEQVAVGPNITPIPLSLREGPHA
jgi:two-component system, NtrC family, sensor histidine kinase GlrK